MANQFEYSGFIDNQFITGEGAAFDIENPSSGSVFARLKGLSVAQTRDAIAAARRAFDCGDWATQPAIQRIALLRRFIECLQANSQELSHLVMQETGCPGHTGVMHAQVNTPLKQATDILELYRSLPELEENPLPLHERVTPMGQSVQSLRRYTPVGVVAAVAAYNMPFYTALWKVLPALVAGNTVVLRPNPLTPLSAMAFAQAALDAGLPAGVLNVVIEAGADGAQLLTTEPAVDMVAFTGSSHVGSQVMAQSAATMKRLQLELGGKSAQIFLPSAIDKAVIAPLAVCAAHAGQGCALGTRIFVPEAHKAELLDKMTAAIKSLRVGRSDDPQTQVGPVINATAVERCERIVAAAVEGGARVLAGGQRPDHLDSGYYFEPTLLDVPDNRNAAAQQEVFGPVVAVIGYRDIDHAIAMANDSDFGLSGYVFSNDVREALSVATRIKSGTVNVNASVFSAYASSGGQRMSGVGRERGAEGLRIYQQVTCLNIGG